MKNIILVAVAVIIYGCGPQTSSNTEKKLPRIAIAGLAIESSTFSPAQTEEEAFHARVAEDIFGFYPFLSPDSANRNRAEWIPTLRAHALPGGIVTKEAYESLMGKTLKMLEEIGQQQRI